MIINRHITLILLSCLYASLSHAELPIEKQAGCIIGGTHGKIIWEKYRLMDESGLPRVDSRTKKEIEEIAEAFGVHSRFAYYNDFDGPNAYAFQQDGDYHVLVGIRILHEMAGTLNPLDSGKIPVQFPAIWEGTTAGVIAHEWAHLLQFKYGLKTSASTNAPFELHADFLAGWYMGSKGRTTKVAYDDLKKRFFLMGDSNFNDPDHHGTKKQRFEALVSGYEIGMSGKRDIFQVFNEGMKKYGLSR